MIEERHDLARRSLYLCEPADVLVLVGERANKGLRGRNSSVNYAITALLTDPRARIRKPRTKGSNGSEDASHTQSISFIFNYSLITIYFLCTKSLTRLQSISFFKGHSLLRNVARTQPERRTREEMVLRRRNTRRAKERKRKKKKKKREREGER